jgi:hypothetical protein
MYFIKNQVNVLENGVAKGKNKLKPIDAPAYSYWQALYMSFYSRFLYVDVGKRWKGIGLVYLLLVVAVTSIPFALKMSADFNKSFNEQLIEPLLQVPTIYIQDGEVKFDKPMPYIIKNDKGQDVIIIDTTGTINEITDAYPHLNILINKNVIYFKLPTPQVMGLGDEQVNKGVSIVQPLAKGANMVFDGKKIVQDNAISGLKYASQLMIYPLVVCILFSIYAIILLVAAFLGQVFSRIFFSFPLTFKNSARLLMVASTPMQTALIIFLSLNLIFPGFGFILLLLIVAYYCFAIYSLRAESRHMVNQ